MYTARALALTIGISLASLTLLPESSPAQRTSESNAVSMLVLLCAPGVPSERTVGGEDTLSAEPAENARDTTYSFDLLMRMMDERRRAATSLSFYSRPDINMHLFYGYRVYRASPYECALQGMGAGMTVGMAAGALGRMTGAWDERRAWYVAGAAAAAGALLGTFKSDDPEWNIRIEWDPDN